MTEDEARAWLTDELAVQPQHLARLEALAELVLAESAHQNLIAERTKPEIWSRHIVDSAQLIPLAACARPGLWVDLGTGAGFPGLVVAILSDAEMVLVESRRLRAQFLAAAVERLELSSRVRIAAQSVESVATVAASVISARAFAPLDRLLRLSHRFSRRETLWLLPKGRNAAIEVEQVKNDWRGMFHVEQSLTDPQSGVIVARGVSERR